MNQYSKITLINNNWKLTLQLKVDLHESNIMS